MIEFLIHVKENSFLVYNLHNYNELQFITSVIVDREPPNVRKHGYENTTIVTI